MGKGFGYALGGFGLFVAGVAFLRPAHPEEWPVWRDAVIWLMGCIMMTVGVGFVRET